MRHLEQIRGNPILFVMLAVTVLACGTAKSADGSAVTDDAVADVQSGELLADVQGGDSLPDVQGGELPPDAQSNDVLPDVQSNGDAIANQDVFVAPDGGLSCQWVDCDDKNLCTDDSCVDGKCQHQNNNNPCNDGNACTTGDACKAGACAAGSGSACDDGNVCTDDSCDTTANACVHSPNTVTCDDKNPCTVQDVCNKGACTGAGKSCDDGNVCTDDLCDTKNGTCQHSAKAGCVAALKPCSTTLDCTSGVCDPTAHVCLSCLSSADCGTGFACLKHSCVASTTCTSGADCKATSQVCWKEASVCVDCVTKNDCATDQACVEHKCVAAPACKSDNACPAVCDTVQGICVGCVTNADCKGGTFCAAWQECVPTACSGQACLGGAVYACTVGGSGYDAGTPCADGNACTDDACDAVKGCTNINNAASCNDYDACTTGDVCAGGSCAGSTVVCTALDQCHTAGTCGSGGCSNPSKGNGATCNDGDSCTTGDVCASGTCSGAAIVCTALDQCHTAGTCSGGSCSTGLSVDCDDQNPCTTDSCNPATVGCVHSVVADGTVCSDGDACTTGDACAAGACKGTTVTCGSGQVCDASGTCVTPVAPAGMVLIPAGTFWMGCNASKDTNCNSDENPQHKVTLSAYYMDLTETTVTQYKACVDASVCTAPSTPSTSTYATYPGFPNNPVNYVNYTQSQAYCKWRGTAFDLPTEAQWEMAARGSCEKNGSTGGDPGCAAAMRTYPWGETTPTASYAVFNTSSTAAVGSLPAGDSPYGLHDMAGNVWEWTRDWYSSTYYGSSPATDPYDSASASYRVNRGGSFPSDAVYLRAGVRGHYTPSSAYDGIGLRCMRSYP